LNSLFVKRRSFPLHNRKRALRAFTQARAQAVAQHVRDHADLAARQFQRAFRASGQALPAAVAFVLINGDNLSLCHNSISPLE
jgi:hypothetical protein